MSEKRHQINKFANYQNIIVRTSPAFDRHVFVLKLIYGFWRNTHDQYTNPLARPLLITLQVVRTSFGFHLRECMEVASPAPELNLSRASISERFGLQNWARDDIQEVEDGFLPR